MSPRCFHEMGTSTSDTEKAIHVAKIVVKRTRIQTIMIMKAHMEISLFRLCLVDMTGLALISQPTLAAMKKRPAVMRKSGPIQVASL